MNTEHWTAEQRELWARLCDFDLDEAGASLDFSRRLARENGWTHAFAKRAVEEYKRFLFLAMSAGHPVTPSDEVDQAWHLHLVYTRSYWDELCTDVLLAPLHHGPTRGGAREGAKFGEWYAKTRASYARFFGASAPLDIWPDAQTRFGDAPHFRRVNARRSWIIEKPRLRIPTRIAPALLIVLALLGAAGAALGAPSSFNIWNWNGAEFLTLFWMLTLLGALAMWWASQTWTEPSDANLPAVPVDAYAIARLRTRNDFAVNAAIINMVEQGQIRMDREDELTRNGSAPAHPFERAVWENIGSSRRSAVEVRKRMGAPLQRLDEQLRALGLLLDAETATKIKALFGGVPLLLGLLAISKIIVGLNRDRPVGFLIISLVIIVVATVFAWNRLPERSGRGDALLAHLKKQHGRGSLSLPTATNSPWPMGVAGSAALAIALWGYDELDAFGMSDYRNRLQPPQTRSDGSSGCSTSSGDSGGGDSGCGGGGCGGGGCGGCGGG